MADSRQNKDTASLAGALASYLGERNAENALVLDLRPFSLWTDFFVIATAQSRASLSGLLRHTKDWAAENGVSIRDKSKTKSRLKKDADDTQNFFWEIIDLDNIAVHIMSKEARAFYELERLWTH